MAQYETPTLREVGSVRELTLGLDSWKEWKDETYFWGHKIPLPGTGTS
ncbi:lasso RiPP family leader peptide-containing protein [Georgenia subflava]|uniref:Lasso RiPP family leader peptide-containing protein n=1 Tax=Georgenia subflava TaxID=1622177 RepID=A0A6N7EPN9_9MICO|nr:lasso RiPP family leader peptide-containing protein [Georgenia subflava]MPV38116.1 lasso RiPP family leader peptide-containing protein [Georgenia subflava]